jgi:hypothetical protein
MKKPPDNPEFARFTDAMKTIMKVPKTAVQKLEPKAQSTPRVGKS